MGPIHIVPCARLCSGHLGIEVELELPVWRLKAFQSGLVPPANNLYPMDGHGALSCIAQHVRLFVSVRLRQ